MTIPRIIHHVWPAHDPIPYTFRAHRKSWERHHGHWAMMMLWDEPALEALPMQNRELYDAAKELAPDDWIRFRADIARLEIIYQYGGVYADMDAECLKSLDPLLDYSCWFAESPNALGHATQAVFASEPGHPFLNYCLNQLSESAHHNADHRINHRVGSRFVDRMYQAQGHDVKLLDWDLFAAQSITARDKGQSATPRGFVNHKYFNTDRHRNSAPQVAAFKAAATILNSLDVEWFLTSGMLLGHIREGRILPWDPDVDIGIWPEDVSKVRDAFSGWQFKRDTDNQMWPTHNGTKIDIHTHHRNGDEVYKIHGPKQDIKMAHPAYLFDDLQPSIFYLQDVLLPSPPEDYLAHMYGDDWLTPKKEWHWRKDPKNVEKI